MALPQAIITLLNNYANSQPAWQLPSLPAGKANPLIGTVLDAAITAASAGTPSATTTTYAAGTPSQWASAAPANVKAAIDRLAAAVYILDANTPIP
jgi:hypothetical protein